MKTYQKLNRFPLSAIRAEGFLKDQMMIGKNGICGQLHKLEPAMINDPFIKKSYVEAWGPVIQAGWGGEISGNYWTGYIQFAFTLDDSEMIETATNWVNEVLKTQKDDGYLGTYRYEGTNMHEDFNAWSCACMMRGLIAFYEATGRQDVLDALHRALLWFCENWSGDKKTFYAAPGIIEIMVLVYNFTGDKALLDFSVEYIEAMCSDTVFKTSYKDMLEDELHYYSNHMAGLGSKLRIPALVYSITGEEKYLKASERKINQVLEKSVQLSGGPVCVAEYVGPVGSTLETEYCCYAFFNATYSSMSYITGEAKYGDLMEQMFYNGAQGAIKKDEKAIAYFNSPNQVYATMESSVSMGDKQVYAPCYPTSCCPVNAVVVIPEFIRGMLLHDDNDDIYVMAYGPCSLKHRGVELKINTFYPFRNKVSVQIGSDKSFGVNLKIPSWCKGYTVKVNGVERKLSVKDKGFVTVKEDWKRGDEIEISFDAKVEIIKVDDSDYAGKHPIAIKYGALLFAYHIPEKWISIEGNPETKLPDGWSWYNVLPDYQQADVGDVNIQLGLRREQFSWNVALDENLTPDDVVVEEVEENGYVWTNPMIKLHTHCYKAPYSYCIHHAKTLEPFCEYQYVTEKQSLVLEPYGCTNLRITYFPKADLKNKKF